MDNNLIKFAAIDFVDDNNVKGYLYWYICEFDDVVEGDRVIAPLGRHNKLQEAVVRKIRYEEEYNAPYPVHSIKYIKKVLKDAEAGNV